MDLSALSNADRRTWRYAKLAALACVLTAGAVLLVPQSGAAFGHSVLIELLLQ